MKLSLIILMMAAGLTEAKAFECHVVRAGVTTPVLKGTWLSGQIGITKLTLIEPRRASLLFQNSDYGANNFDGTYTFHNNVGLNRTMDSKVTSFWTKIFGDADQVDRYFGVKPLQLFYLTQGKEFQYLSVTFVAAKDAIKQSSFKARFSVDSHGYISDDSAKERTPIEDRLLCTQTSL